jgi:predicted nucleic acid-binding protein
MYLFDTNTIIYYLNTSLPETAMKFVAGVLEESCFISVISKIEALGFNFTSEAEKKVVTVFIGGLTLLELDDAVANATIAIRSAHKIKLPDAIIAATAIAYDLTLLTRNVGDFKNIAGLQLQNPWDK